MLGDRHGHFSWFSVGQVLIKGLNIYQAYETIRLGLWMQIKEDPSEDGPSVPFATSKRLNTILIRDNA